MADTRPLPSDYAHQRDRDAGLYICQCPVPDPTPVWLFATVQCQRCLRPILRHTQQQG